MLKKGKLRYNEYYNMQKVFDSLYAASKNGNNFYKLLEIIGSEENIRLAYRNLKKNTGSKTAGTDGKTIEDIKALADEEVITTIRNMLDDYKPKSVRRVYIPKPGSDKKRPLGIPCIWDRLFQQCILQVLEPICEPKFHNHSYGFRPNRGADHAIARTVFMINRGKHYYCVDIDIKGFFDNVDHGKLLKQIWTLGIRDKRLICIISKLLKAEIEGEGIPTKGTPQGGIISPLLSLIVLNELDWWVSNQWETFNTTWNSVARWRNYAQEHTGLKDGYIVRYADDFKIMCRTYEEAQRWFHATADFLKTRLKLDISPEKSKVVNMRHNASTYLGFNIKVVPKGNTEYGYVAKTDMSEKALRKVKSNLRAKLTNIRNNPINKTIDDYNSAVRGIQNYYCIATNVYGNLSDVNYTLLPAIRNRLREISKTIPFSETDIEFQKQAVGIRKETKIVQIGDRCLMPLTAVHHKHPISFTQSICNYTVSGREKVHSDLMVVSPAQLEALSRSRDRKETVEFNDNRISAFIVQQGNCYITGNRLDMNDMNCLRKKPSFIGGTDAHTNIVFVCGKIAEVIFGNNTVDLSRYLNDMDITESGMNKLNEIRRNYGYRTTI